MAFAIGTSYTEVLDNTGGNITNKTVTVYPINDGANTNGNNLDLVSTTIAGARTDISISSTVNGNQRTHALTYTGDENICMNFHSTIEDTRIGNTTMTVNASGKGFLYIQLAGGSNSGNTAFSRTDTRADVTIGAATGEVLTGTADLIYLTDVMKNMETNQAGNGIHPNDVNNVSTNFTARPGHVLLGAMGAAAGSFDTPNTGSPAFRVEYRGASVADGHDSVTFTSNNVNNYCVVNNHRDLNYNKYYIFTLGGNDYLFSPRDINQSNNRLALVDIGLLSNLNTSPTSFTATNVSLNIRPRRTGSQRYDVDLLGNSQTGTMVASWVSNGAGSGVGQFQHSEPTTYTMGPGTTFNLGNRPTQTQQYPAATGTDPLTGITAAYLMPESYILNLGYDEDAEDAGVAFYARGNTSFGNNKSAIIRNYPFAKLATQYLSGTTVAPNFVMDPILDGFTANDIGGFANATYDGTGETLWGVEMVPRIQDTLGVQHGTGYVVRLRNAAAMGQLTYTGNAATAGLKDMSNHNDPYYGWRVDSAGNHSGFPLYFKGHPSDGVSNYTTQSYTGTYDIWYVVEGAQAVKTDDLQVYNSTADTLIDADTRTPTISTNVWTGYDSINQYSINAIDTPTATIPVAVGATLGDRIELFADTDGYNADYLVSSLLAYPADVINAFAQTDTNKTGTTYSGSTGYFHYLGLHDYNLASPVTGSATIDISDKGDSNWPMRFHGSPVLSTANCDRLKLSHGQFQIDTVTGDTTLAWDGRTNVDLEGEIKHGHTFTTLVGNEDNYSIRDFTFGTNSTLTITGGGTGTTRYYILDNVSYEGTLTINRGGAGNVIVVGGLTGTGTITLGTGISRVFRKSIVLNAVNDEFQALYPGASNASVTQGTQVYHAVGGGLANPSIVNPSGFNGVGIANSNASVFQMPLPTATNGGERFITDGTNIRRVIGTRIVAATGGEYHHIVQTDTAVPTNWNTIDLYSGVLAATAPKNYFFSLESTTQASPNPATEAHWTSVTPYEVNTVVSFDNIGLGTRTVTLNYTIGLTASVYWYAALDYHVINRGVMPTTEFTETPELAAHNQDQINFATRLSSAKSGPLLATNTNTSYTISNGTLTAVFDNLNNLTYTQPEALRFHRGILEQPDVMEQLARQGLPLNILEFEGNSRITALASSAVAGTDLLVNLQSGEDLTLACQMQVEVFDQHGNDQSRPIPSAQEGITTNTIARRIDYLNSRVVGNVAPEFLVGFRQQVDEALVAQDNRSNHSTEQDVIDARNVIIGNL